MLDEDPSLEDGECSSDDSIAGYNPIERPVDQKPSVKPAGRVLYQ